MMHQLVQMAVAHGYTYNYAVTADYNDASCLYIACEDPNAINYNDFSEFFQTNGQYIADVTVYPQMFLKLHILTV